MEVVLNVIYSYRSFGVNTQFPGGGGGKATKELQEGDIDACYTHATLTFTLRKKQCIDSGLQSGQIICRMKLSCSLFYNSDSTIRFLRITVKWNHFSLESAISSTNDFKHFNSK